MSKFALLVGINYIGTQNELQGCINDVLNMKNILETKFGYKNFTVLTDNTDVKPTKNNIMQNLKSLISNSQNYSEILFHYSGHGTQVADKNNDEVDRKDEALVPLDFMSSGFILDDDLYTIIKDAKCNTKIILDSCHSATCIDLPYVSLFNSAGKLATQRKDKNTSINTRYDIFMISGCRDEQTSSDIYDIATKKNCGALTNALVNLLTNNSNISLSLLLSSLNVILKYYAQNPAFSANKQANMNLPFLQNITPNIKPNVQAPNVQAPIVRKTTKNINIKKISIQKNFNKTF